MSNPVLIAPVVSRFDLLERMVLTVKATERLVIVDNSLSGYELPEHVHASLCPTITHVDYIRPLIGLGYPGGINAGITQTPEAPWWVWASNDLEFGAPDLPRIRDLMVEASGPRMVTGSHRGLRNVYGAMNAAAVQAIGLFDEWEFYPIYFDDDDMERRCRLGGVEWVTYDGTMRHAGSQTIQEDWAARANSASFRENARRYVAKWGGLPGSELFQRPYNMPVPLSFVRPDTEARASRIWKQQP